LDLGSLESEVFFLSCFLSDGSSSSKSNPMAAEELSPPYVSQILTLFKAVLRISEIAIAAIMHVTGASTSMSLIITQEK